MGNGLNAEYFDNPNFTGAVVKRIDPTVNFNWGNGGRGVHVFSSDNVLVRHNTLYKNLQTLDIGDGTRIGGGELTAIAASNVWFVNNIVYSGFGND